MGLLSRFGSAYKKPDEQLKAILELAKPLASRRRLDIGKRLEPIGRPKATTTGRFLACRDRETGIQVGLKILEAEKIKPYLSRYQGTGLPSEGQLWAAAQGPGVVTLLEYGKTKDGEDYLLLQFMDGPRLDQLMEQGGIRSMQQKMRLVKRLAFILESVHQAGLIHRDFCPRNLICNAEMSEVKLIDFGTAVPNTPEFCKRVLRVGTPIYMAPEVMRRRSLATSADMFSFGVTVYQLLSGEHPWSVSENSSRAALVFDTTAPKPIQSLVPGLADRVADAIHRCLIADPEKRFSSCKHFLAATGDLSAGHQPGQAKDPGEDTVDDRPTHAR